MPNDWNQKKYDALDLIHHEMYGWFFGLVFGFVFGVIAVLVHG